jgi:Holliday junction resolvase RusA-like endonuclease
MRRISLFIPGIPKPKQSVRSRIVQANGKTFAQHYQTKAIKDEERSIKMIIREQLPEDFICHNGPVTVESLDFRFPALKSMKKMDLKFLEDGGSLPKTTKPDLTDNLQKLLFDAMQGLVYANDSQIWHVQATKKIYHRTPGISLVLNLH